MTDTSTSKSRRLWTNGNTRRWGRRALAVTGAVLAVVVVVVAAAVWALDRDIERVEVEGLDEGDLDSIADGPVGTSGGTSDGDASALADRNAEELTVLVLGIDSREDLSEREQQELGTGYAPGARAEVIALTRLDPVADEVRLLSVPRDGRVELCDGTVGRINEAYDIGEETDRGGASCTVQTVTALTGVAIDHVVTVDFGGFVEIVDDLGGVSLELEEPLEDDKAHLDLPAGCVDLDGRDALAFVRARQADDDFGRIGRQHRFAEELLDELAGLGVLDDLPRLLRVADSVAGSVQLDSSLDLLRLQELVREHRSTIAGELDTRAVPGEVVMVGEASMVELDDERMEQLVPWLVDGQLDSVDEGGDAQDEGAGSADESGPDDGGSDSELGEPETLGGDEPVAAEGSESTGGC